MDAYWWLFSILASMGTAAVYLLAQYLPFSALLKTFWRGFVPLIALLPFFAFIELPTNPVFYIATLLTSLIVSYTDNKTFETAEKYGAGVTTRLKPFVIWFVFIIWFMWDSSTRELLLSNKIESAMIVFVLMLGGISAFFMHKCSISREAIFFYFPVILLAALTDVLNKMAMDASPLISGVITYAWIQAFIISVVTLLRNKVSCSFSWQDVLRTLPYGILFGSAMIVINIFKNTAMSFTLNPSYVTAIIFCAPVWVSLYYRLIKHKEEVQILPGYGFVLSAILLIIITA